ncbi:hypothetical protein EV1_028260 [Malus domestica]
MATSITPSSLVLTYASSYSHPQDLTPSLVSFQPKPLFKTFCLCPLALRPREIKPSKCANSEPQRVPAAALTAEAEVSEDVDENEEVKGGDGSVAVAVSSKPKKGKAALLLKRDRTRSKRFLEIQKLRETKKEYALQPAIALLKEMTNTKFVETAEAHFRLNIDPKYNDQQLRATANFLILLVRYMFSYQCLALYYILSLIVEFFYNFSPLHYCPWWRKCNYICHSV